MKGSWLRAIAACAVALCICSCVLGDANRLPVIAGQGLGASSEAASLAIPRIADIAPEDAPAPALPHDERVVIARISPDADAAQLTAALARADGVASGTVTDRDVQRGFAVLPLAEGVEVARAMVQLQAVPGLEGAQPDYEYTLQADDAEEATAPLTAADLVAYDETDDASGEAPDDSADSPPDEAPDDEPAKATVDDPRAPEQWALDSIHAYEAWAITKARDDAADEPKVVVATLDNGCLVDHEDLAENIVDTYNAAVAGQAEEAERAGETAQAEGSDPADAADRFKDVTPFIDNHGTHVAGIVAARANNGVGVAGASYNAGLLPVQVFRKTESGGNTAKVSDIAIAYDYLMAYNADETHEAKVRVVNFSLGVKMSADSTLDEEDTLLVSKVGEAHKAGILTVLSSGNNGSSGPYLNFPSDWLPDELSAISLQEGTAQGDDGEGASSPKRTNSSNYNTPNQTTKDLSAPGNQILSTGSSSQDNYAKKSGTSMASPCIAGVAALVFAANPQLSPDDVAEILCETATDLGEEGWDAEYGAGEVNAFAAVEAAAAWQPAPPDQPDKPDQPDQPEPTPKTRIEEASVTLASKLAFTGAKRTPKPALTHAGSADGAIYTLQEGVDYTLSYQNNLHVGTATVQVKGLGNYEGTRTLSFAITKAANPMKLKTAMKNVKRSLLARKARTVKGAISFAVKPRGTATYTKLSSGSSSRLAVNKKTGAITVKRNTKAGIYRIRVRVKAAGTADYQAKSQTVTVRIRVK